MSVKPWKVIGAGLLLATAAVGGETRVENAELQVGLSIPDGFDTAPPQTQRAIFSFHKPVGGEENITIGVDRMGGTIGREAIELASYEKKIRAAPGMENAKFSLEQVPWRSFQLSVIRSELDLQGHDWMLLQAQVPMKPEAVLVTVGGPRSHEQEVRAVLTSVVGSATGETNWLTMEQRRQKAILPTGVAVAVALILILRRVRRARST
ncbi:MAG TPA: hypothetical protein VND93_12350 [Myxococcales bacterium]|jgi:hypothetical protein|nr:hypothetical protein [Myxococcales bacterium]